MQFVKKQIRPGIVVLEIHDSIQMGPILQHIERAVDEFIRQNEKVVIFDLSRVTYVDSTGIGTIVRLLSRLKKVGGTLRLTGVNGMVEGVLKLTQVDKLIEISSSVADASRDLPPAPNP
ncbi:MAG TPA: STAS domain-containing protein [Terriglobia bacterium]|nr:STAS domain-containing protein [Terriglobia bacterium]